MTRYGHCSSNRTLEELKRSKNWLCFKRIFTFQSHLIGIETALDCVLYLCSTYFQSHLRGIETRTIADDKEPLTPSNRTLEELKLDRNLILDISRGFQSHLRGIETR